MDRIDTSPVPSSYPCIKCGRELTRASDEYEAQPNDGVMCSTTGNYGSTVFDPMDGQAIAFNICDDCLVRLGKLGRLYAYREFTYVVIDHKVVGKIYSTHVYVPWHKDLADDGVGEIKLDSIDELKTLLSNRSFVLFASGRRLLGGAY